MDVLPPDLDAAAVDLRRLSPGSGPDQLERLCRLGADAAGELSSGPLLAALGGHWSAALAAVEVRRTDLARHLRSAAEGYAAVEQRLAAQAP